MKKPKVAEKTDPLSVGRHVGQYIWGYEVMPDGSIKLAPGFCDRMKALMDQQKAISILQHNVSSFVTTELTRMSKMQREWWDELQKEFGIEIPKGSGWTFDGYDTIRKIETEAKDQEPLKK